MTDANESSAKFSPDGKWIVYASDESGHPEIYAQPFLVENGGKWQVSTKGGYTPKWSSDGKELFFLSLDNYIMSSQLQSSPFSANTPRPLFLINPFAIPRIAPWFEAFEPELDGQHFLVHSSLTTSSPTMTVVLNWPLLLGANKSKVP